MVSSEISEESTDWVQIQYPFHHQPSSPPPQGQRLDFDYELVIRDNFYNDNSSVFPPSEHQDLPLHEDCDSPRIMLSSRSPSSSASSEASMPKEQPIKSSDSRLSVMMNEIGTRMYTIGIRMYQGFVCSSSRRCASIIPASVLAVVALFTCLKILQWRNRLILLLREKDQRISQLMHQIAHMNEILSARRKVPVLRI